MQISTTAPSSSPVSSWPGRPRASAAGTKPPPARLPDPRSRPLPDQRRPLPASPQPAQFQRQPQGREPDRGGEWAARAARGLHNTSPSTSSGSRLVASTRLAFAAAATVAATTLAATRTCSQLSSSSMIARSRQQAERPTRYPYQADSIRYRGQHEVRDHRGLLDRAEIDEPGSVGVAAAQVAGQLYCEPGLAASGRAVMVRSGFAAASDASCPRVSARPSSGVSVGGSRAPTAAAERPGNPGPDPGTVDGSRWADLPLHGVTWFGCERGQVGSPARIRRCNPGELCPGVNADLVEQSGAGVLVGLQGLFWCDRGSTAPASAPPTFVERRVREQPVDADQRAGRLPGHSRASTRRADTCRAGFQ